MNSKLFLCLALVFIGASVRAADLSGTYTGTASGRVGAIPVTTPISFTLKPLKGQSYPVEGKILVPVVQKSVKITGSATKAGRLLAYTQPAVGVKASFTATIKGSSLTGTGSVRISSVGTFPVRISAKKGGSGSSDYTGIYLAQGTPNGPAVTRVDIQVTQDGVASIKFTAPSQKIHDNAKVAKDGRFTGVVNGFVYFITLSKGGAFSGTYQSGTLGSGSFTGNLVSRKGVLSSLAGSYRATSSNPSQPSIKVTFSIGSGGGISGAFFFRSGPSVSFSNQLGSINTFTGTTAGGISYFAKVAGDGTFSLDYQGPPGNGSFEGKML